MKRFMGMMPISEIEVAKRHKSEEILKHYGKV